MKVRKSCVDCGRNAFPHEVFPLSTNESGAIGKYPLDPLPVRSLLRGMQAMQIHGPDSLSQENQSSRGKRRRSLDNIMNEEDEIGQQQSFTVNPSMNQVFYHQQDAATKKLKGAMEASRVVESIDGLVTTSASGDVMALKSVKCSESNQASQSIVLNKDGTADTTESDSTIKRKVHVFKHVYTFFVMVSDLKSLVKHLLFLLVLMLSD
jgi:hypothetical protein